MMIIFIIERYISYMKTIIQQNSGEDEENTPKTKGNEEDLTDNIQELQILQGEKIT